MKRPLGFFYHPMGKRAALQQKIDAPTQTHGCLAGFA
jgi:hypothetical protein